MRKIGDIILYGAVGIMEIVNITSESIGDAEKSYYVLKEINTGSDSKIYVPVDNERLTAQMHSLLTPAALSDCLLKSKSCPETKWESNNRLRSEQYRKIMESGDRLAIISMIKSIEKMGIARAELGKKNYIADESAMRRAVKLISLEISIVLSLTLEEAERFFFEKIK